MSYRRLNKYKWCMVPNCKSTTVKTPEKLFIKVPDNFKRRKTWLELAWRDPNTISTKSILHFCEDHFDLQNDMENYMEYKIMGKVKVKRMKPNCIPTRFDCQPQRKSILKPTSPQSAIISNENATTENINASLITTTLVIKRKRKSLVQETETTINKNWVEIPSSCHEPDGSREKNIPSNVQEFDISLSCRTVRIGSYKFTTKEKVNISANGIKIVAPSLRNETTDVLLQIETKQVCRVLVHFGKALPVIFLYTMFKCARNIRTSLGMVEDSGPFYDPFSKLHAFKVITLLPEAISDEAEVVLKALFGQMMDELDHRKANDILRRTQYKIRQNNRLQTGSRGRKNKYDDSDQRRKSSEIIESVKAEDGSEVSGPDVELSANNENLNMLPQNGYMVPQIGDILPQNGEILSQNGDILPLNGDILPQNGYILPHTSNYLLQNGDINFNDHSLLPETTAHKSHHIPEDVPDKLLDLKKQKMEFELALAKEQLQIAKRERYKLDLELFKLEKEFNISPSNFTTQLYNLQNEPVNGLSVKEDDLQYERLNGVSVKEEQA